MAKRMSKKALARRQAAGLLKTRPAGSKYGAKPTIYNGVRYASKAEAKRAHQLDMLLSAGEIIEWIGQPKFRLGVPENVYVADFLVIDRAGNAWVEDVKGQRTAKFNRDLKLWRAYGRLPLHVIGSNGTEVIETEQAAP